jgi:uncharacterized protein YdhG (YjbR/CyaY superfamily)
MTAPNSVEEYLAALPERSRAAVEELRATIRAGAPGATEVIAYGIPTFKVGGRMLLSCAAFTHHCSLFPASGMVLEALGDRVTPYLSGRATARFRIDDPLPLGLVSEIVKVRLEEVASGSGTVRA